MSLPSEFPPVSRFVRHGDPKKFAVYADGDAILQLYFNRTYLATYAIDSSEERQFIFERVDSLNAQVSAPAPVEEDMTWETASQAEKPHPDSFKARQKETIVSKEKVDYLADLRAYIECDPHDFQHSEWKRMDQLRAHYPLLCGGQNGFWVGHDAIRNQYILFFRVIALNETDATAVNFHGVHPLFIGCERLNYLFNERFPH